MAAPSSPSPAPDKRAVREAAERIERGIEAYGAGDLAACVRELEAALSLSPLHVRAQLYLSWVRDLQAGQRKPDGAGAIDEDTLDAMSAALTAEGEATGERRFALGATFAGGDDDEDTTGHRARRPAAPAAQAETPWDPVPLTPGGRHPAPSSDATTPDAVAPPTAAAAVASAAPASAAPASAAPASAAPASAAPHPAAPASAAPLPAAPASVAPLPATVPGFVPQRTPLPSAGFPTQRTPAPTPPSGSFAVQRTPAQSPPTGSGFPAQRTPAPGAPGGFGTQRTPAGTLLGVPSDTRPLLSPVTPRALHPADDPTGAMTREFRAEVTGTNLPPLDVPELTDEQVQELLALDGTPVLDVRPGESVPHLPAIPGAATAQPMVASLLEIEAEPTPVPHRNPLSPRARDATTPDSDVADFDGLEMTPTRERRDLLKAVMQPLPGSDDAIELPPLLDLPDEDRASNDGTNPTNPFINRRLAEYAPPGQAPRVDDLPEPPVSKGATAPTPVVETVNAIQEPLEAGEVQQALEAAEAFIAREGGLESQASVKHRWLLERVFETAIGPLGSVPVHGSATPDLDPKAAFLLSRIDGVSSVEDLLDVSGMPRLDALRVLALLLRRGVVAMAR